MVFEDVELRPEKPALLPDPLVRLVRAMRASTKYDHRAVRLGDLGQVTDFAGWVIEQAAAHACGNPEAEKNLWVAYRWWQDDLQKEMNHGR